ISYRKIKFFRGIYRKKRIEHLSLFHNRFIMQIGHRSRYVVVVNIVNFYISKVFSFKSHFGIRIKLCESEVKKIVRLSFIGQRQKSEKVSSEVIKSTFFFDDKSGVHN